MLINIPKRSNLCAKGQEALGPGTTYYSVIINTPQEGVVRQDYCSGCWEQSGRHEHVARTRGYWKSSVVEKKQQPQTSHDHEKQAFDLLKQLLASEAQDDQAEAFLLALYLARKRLLQRRQHVKKPDGHTVIIYETIDAEEIFCVPTIPLKQLQALSIQERLANKLKI